MKKRILKRFLSIVTAFSVLILAQPYEHRIVSATQNRSGNFSTNYTLTGNLADDIVAVAKAQVGKTGSNLGYSEHWCADFATDCARKTKMSESIVPYNDSERGAVKSLYKTMRDKCHAEAVSTPQKGDFIFFDWKGTKSVENLGHVGIVTGFSNGKVTYIGGNEDGTGNPSYYNSKVVSRSYASSYSCIMGYLRPNYPDSKHIVSFYYNANGGTIASDSEYYADSKGIIRRKSDDAGNLNNWDKDTRSDYGLYNASTMKLTRKNCVFLGWSLSENSGTIYDQDDNTVTAKTFFPDIETKSGSVTFYAQWGGREMKESECAGRTIPDGDYWIVNGLGRGYLVDIEGDTYNTADKTNVQMHLWDTNNWSEYDVFTVKYLNNGFYSITQRTTKMALDCANANNDKRHRANVIMYSFKNSANQQWSIKNTTSGYTLQNRANGMFLDVKSDKTDNSNLHIFEATDLASQLYSFVPYGAGQPIKDGTVCRIGTLCGKGAYVDAAGTPKDYKNNTNVQIWDADGDNYFRFEYLNNGFYHIINNQTGHMLDIYTGGDKNLLTYGRNVQLYEEYGSLEQEWALLPAEEDGYYYIVSKLNGRCLDLAKSNTDNGTNIAVWSKHTGSNQKWSIVTNKEFKVTPPTKTVYNIGDQLDLTGMSAIMVYSDGYEHNVTSAVKVSCDLSKIGKTTATVIYENGGIKNTKTFVVEVTEEPIETSINTTETAVTTETTTTTTTTTEPLIPDTIEVSLLAGKTYTIENTEPYYVYYSNDQDVAIVSNNGVITAKHIGEAIVTVIMADGETAQIHVTVQPIMGDVDENGVVDIKDAVALMKWLLNVNDHGVSDWKAGDMNGDGKLNAIDLTLLKQTLLQN